MIFRVYLGVFSPKTVPTYDLELIDSDSSLHIHVYSKSGMTVLAVTTLDCRTVQI